MVRKEIATHFLAYNLIRGIMSEAARVADVEPRTLSFKKQEGQCPHQGGFFLI
jgi:hypothetical protein